MENKTITYLITNIRGYRLMVKLTAFQAVAMGSSPIIRKFSLQFLRKGLHFLHVPLA